MDEYDRWLRAARREVVWQSAARDAQILLFRRLWERLRPAARNEFKCALYTLAGVADTLSRLSRHLLAAPNVSLGVGEDWPEEAFAADPLAREARRAGESFVTPGEYLCAIACWEAGEVYVPTDLLIWDHPRWPLVNPWDTTDAAPEPPS
jgi:hypothetical protein